VADIRGTSPKVWNAWKAKLLEDLYRATRRVLAGEAPLPESAVAEHQAEAARLLRLYALSEHVQDRFWAQLDTTYFPAPRPAGDRVADAQPVLPAGDAKPVVKARLAPIGEGTAGADLYAGPEGLFARICGYFGRSGFNIVEAKIHTTRKRYALDTFLVMGHGGGVHYRDLITLIELGLAEELEASPPLAAPRTTRISRRVRYYPISPSVDIRPDERGAYHVLSIVGADRAGLLYAMARVLADHHIHLHSGAHQHAGRPCRGRLPDLRRAAARPESRAADRAGAARRAAGLSGYSSGGRSAPGNSASMKPKRVRSTIRLG
jgi:[protein-PII] uridylyltransferase